MRVLGKIKNNFVVELTPYELEAIGTALMEWQEIENETSEPVKAFGKVLTRIFKAKDKFDSLPVITVQKLLKP
jgi:hypothetical protein